MSQKKGGQCIKKTFAPKEEKDKSVQNIKAFNIQYNIYNKARCEIEKIKLYNTCIQGFNIWYNIIEHVVKLH